MEEQAKTPITGEIIGTVKAVQLPDIPCSKVMFKAIGTNTGNAYLGGKGVTTLKGNNNETTGYELDATDETPFFWISNLNKLSLICGTAGDALVYIAFK